MEADSPVEEGSAVSEEETSEEVALQAAGRLRPAPLQADCLLPAVLQKDKVVSAFDYRLVIIMDYNGPEDRKHFRYGFFRRSGQIHLQDICNLYQDTPCV